MLGCKNIKKESVDIVATIQGQATTVVLSDDVYEKKFGTKNPNKIIELLSQYGVKLFVCSQATAYGKLNHLI